MFYYCGSWGCINSNVQCSFSVLGLKKKKTRRNLETANKNKYKENKEAIGLVHLWK